LRLYERLIRHPVCDSRDAVFDEHDVEIDEHAQTLVGQSQVRQQLFLVYRGESFDRFDLHDDLVLHNQIRPKPHLDPRALIGNRNWLLADNAKTSSFQFVGQNCFVERTPAGRVREWCGCGKPRPQSASPLRSLSCKTTSRKESLAKTPSSPRKLRTQNPTRGTAVQAGIVHNLEMAPVDGEERQAVPANEYGRRSGVDPEGIGVVPEPT
jgi:hypothetical protein